MTGVGGNSIVQVRQEGSPEGKIGACGELKWRQEHQDRRDVNLSPNNVVLTMIANRTTKLPLLSSVVM